MSEDQLITQDVQMKLANDSRLSGVIGVETRDRIVKLMTRVGAKRLF